MPPRGPSFFCCILLLTSLGGGQFAVETTQNLLIPRDQLAVTSNGNYTVFGFGRTFQNGAMFPSTAIETWDINEMKWISENLTNPLYRLTSCSTGNFSFFIGANSVADNAMNYVYFRNFTKFAENETSSPWTYRTLSDNRHGLSCGRTSKNVLIAGGNSQVLDIYNIQTGLWKTVLNSTFAVPMLASTASVGDYVVFAGGLLSPSANITGKVLIWNGLTETWTSNPPSLSLPRCKMAATSVGNLAFFAGGYTDTFCKNVASGKIEIWSSENFQFTSISLPDGSRRAGMAATNIAHFALFAGGYEQKNNLNEFSNEINIWDAQLSRWSLMTLAQPRAFLAAAPVGSSFVFFAGGMSAPNITSTLVDVLKIDLSPPIVSPFEPSLTVIAIAGAFAAFMFLCGCITLLAFFVYARNQKSAVRQRADTDAMFAPAFSEILLVSNTYQPSRSVVGAKFGSKIVNGTDYQPNLGEDHYVAIGKNTSPTFASTSSALTWDIPYHEITMQQEIGGGEFGVVHRGKWRAVDVAVKILKLASSQAESEFQKEFLLMKNLRPHPNIIQVLGLCQKPFSIVTEFMPNGSLYHHIRAGNLKPQKIPEIIHGVVAGLFHLHTEGIVHRDLASRNVLLDVTEKPKISDFGMASAVHQQSSGAMYGPLRIMAPECLLEQKFSVKSDVWSFGLLLVELYSQTDIYPGMSGEQVVKHVIHGESHVIPDNTPVEVAEVMMMCWQFQPEDRPDVKTLEQIFSGIMQN